MPAKIRLKRVGRTGQPAYRVVVVDEGEPHWSGFAAELLAVFRDLDHRRSLFLADLDRYLFVGFVVRLELAEDRRHFREAVEHPEGLQAPQKGLEYSE